MVRRFTRDDGVSGLNLAKSSAARAVRGKIADQFPFLTDNEILDELIPKKAAVYIAKWCAEAALRGGCRSLLSVIRKHHPSQPLTRRAGRRCSQNHIQLVVIDSVPLFFGDRDGNYYPLLRVLHQCTPHP